MSWFANVTTHLYDAFWSAFWYAPRDFLKYAASTHFYRFPEVLWGYENADKRWICARLLKSQESDISDDMLNNICERKIDRILSSRVDVIVTIIGVLLIRELWRYIWTLPFFMTDEKKLAITTAELVKGYEVQCELREKLEKKAPPVKSEQEKRIIANKRQTALFINNTCKDIVRNCCMLLDLPLSDEQRLNGFRKEIDRAERMWFVPKQPSGSNLLKQE